MSLALICCRSDALTGRGNGRPVVPAPQIFWFQPDVAANCRPAVDATRAFFLGRAHEVTAVAKADGRILWRVTLPLAGIETSGNAVVWAGGNVVVGDVDVFGLDPASGAIRWRFTPAEGRGPGRALLAARGDTVLAGSVSGHLYAFEAATGTEIWRTRVPETSIIQDSTVVLDPVIDGNMIFAAFFERQLTAFPFFRGGAMAVEMATGRVVWSSLLPQPYAPDIVSNGTFGAVAPTPTTAAVWSQTGYVYGLNRADGSLRWIVPPDSAVLSTSGRPSGDFRPLATDGTRIMIGNDQGWITAVDGATGSQLWRVKTPYGTTGRTMWMDRGYLYAVHLGGQMSSYLAATGALRWGLNDGRTETTLGMAFDGERLYAGDIGGGVFSAAR